MKLLIISLNLLLTISCNLKQESNSPSNDIYVHLLEEYIRQDSIELDCVIDDRLHPYKYYKLEYIDGVEIPPPGPDGHGTSYANEHSLIGYINSSTISVDSLNVKYFSSNCDSSNLKFQILHSAELDELPDISKWSEKYNTKIDEFYGEIYYFYIPLFNCDSTQVYLQYDYHKGSYGHGNGAVFEKHDDGWKLVSRIPGWIT